MAHERTTGHLRCPRCGGEMEQYDRSHVIIDQCSRCGGVFLDRGELERLMDAEGSYYGSRGVEHRPEGGFLGGLFGGQHGGGFGGGHRGGGHHGDRHH